MALNANRVPSASSGPRQEPLEPATYPGRIVSIVSLGLQEQRPYNGQAKDPAYELNVTYELLDEFVKDEDGNPQEDKPRWISETFAFHNLRAEKAKSTLRYKVLDPTMQYQGDWTKLLGAPCLVTVITNPGKGPNAGKVYNNVASISPMRQKEAISAPALVNEPYFFDFEEPDLEVFEKLPSFIQDKIKRGLEYNGSKLQAALEGGTVESSATEESDSDEPENF